MPFIFNPLNSPRSVLLSNGEMRTIPAKGRLYIEISDMSGQVAKLITEKKLVSLATEPVGTDIREFLPVNMGEPYEAPVLKEELPVEKEKIIIDTSSELQEENVITEESVSEGDEDSGDKENNNSKKNSRKNRRF